jgi:hypothetical protein
MVKIFFKYSNVLILTIFIVAFQFFTKNSFSQNYIDVKLIGYSDGKRNSKQQDREEAIINAKLQAIEKAGINIKSVTTVENFMLKKDWIESKADAYIQPGFATLDMGYGEDGVYKVVLIGKVSSALINTALVNLTINVDPRTVDWYYNELDYEIYLDGKLISTVEGGKKSVKIDDIKPGEHTITLEFLKDCFWEEPKYKYNFSNELTKNVILERGNPNIITLKPEIYAPSVQINEAKYIIFGKLYYTAGDKYRDETFTHSFTDINGMTHNIKIHSQSKRVNIITHRRGWWLKVFINGNLEKDLRSEKGKEPYPEILFENTIFKISTLYKTPSQRAGYRSGYGLNLTVIRKDLSE